MLDVGILTILYILIFIVYLNIPLGMLPSVKSKVVTTLL